MALAIGPMDYFGKEDSSDVFQTAPNLVDER
jgi:hypothetical protein